MKRARFRAVPVAMTLAIALAGCNTDAAYYLTLAGGELASLTHTRPVAIALIDPTVTSEQKSKLQRVQQLRDFAVGRIGLNAATSFLLYEDNAAGPAAYSVSASPKDALQSLRFEFPIVGEYDAKPFFDLAMARQAQAQLVAQGFDTYLAQIEGFSTGGILPDPIRASNLTLDDIDLAEFELHELTHNTIYKLNDTDFNESMATFVGRRAAQRFFDETYGPDSAESAAARSRFADKAVIDAYVVDLYRKLSDFYAQPISSDAKIAGRQAVFDAAKSRFTNDILPTLNDAPRFGFVSSLPINNAYVLAAVRYQAGLDVYQAVFDKVGGDFAALLNVLRQAAAQADSKAFLQAWPAAQQN